MRWNWRSARFLPNRLIRELPQLSPLFCAIIKNASLILAGFWMLRKKFTRLFYTTDIHGSEICFKKFLNASKFYKTDVLILGGDVTGKLIVPIVRNPDGTFQSDFFGEHLAVKTEEEARRIESKIRDCGFYAHFCTEAENEEIQKDQKKRDALFFDIMRDTLLRWVKMAEERLKGTDTICYITGGNDDHQEVIEAFKDTEHVKNPDNKVVRIDELHEMASLGWGNPTPWKCPRDCSSEEELGERIETLVSQLEDTSNSVFNFHVPPKDSGLDEAPLLDTSTYPPKPVIKSGHTVLVNVGSISVRNAIEKLQPLVVLTGHIHESRGTVKIGKSMIINPGSEYSEGIMRGVIVNLGDKKILSYQLTSG